MRVYATYINAGLRGSRFIGNCEVSTEEGTVRLTGHRMPLGLVWVRSICYVLFVPWVLFTLPAIAITVTRPDGWWYIAAIDGCLFLVIAVGLGGVDIRTTYRGPQFYSRQTEFLRRIPWQQTPNVFAAARSAGFNVALAGYYFPYSRMFNNSLTECAWWPQPLQINSTGDTLARKIRGQIESVFETESFSPFGQSLSTRHQARICREFLEKAKAEASNPAMGFVFLHAPIPHAPHAPTRSA